MNIYTFYKTYMSMFRMKKNISKKEYIIPMTLLQFLKSINIEVKPYSKFNNLFPNISNPYDIFQQTIEYYKPRLIQFSEYNEKQKKEFITILNTIDPNKDWKVEIKDNTCPEIFILKILTVYYPFDINKLNISEDMPFNPWFYICLNALTIDVTDGFAFISFSVPFNAIPYLYVINQEVIPDFPKKNTSIYNRYELNNINELCLHFYKSIEKHYNTIMATHHEM